MRGADCRRLKGTDRNRHARSPSGPFILEGKSIPLSVWVSVGLLSLVSMASTRLNLAPREGLQVAPDWRHRSRCRPCSRQNWRGPFLRLTFSQACQNRLHPYRRPQWLARQWPAHSYPWVSLPGISCLRCRCLLLPGHGRARTLKVSLIRFNGHAHEERRGVAIC